MKLAPLLAIFAAVWCGAQAPAPILSANPPMEALSLADAKREAVTNSPTLAALRARVSAASAVWRQARASQAPTLSASYAASRLQHQPTGGFSTGGPESATSLALDLEYLLYDGGARKHQISATEHDQLAEELSLQEGLRGLRFAVARAYLGILLAEARGQVAHAEQEINAIFLRDVEVRAKLGAAARTDALNFQLRINNAKLRVRNAVRDAHVNRFTLLALMGRAGDSHLAVQQVPIQPLNLELPEARRQAMQQRPDLEQLREQLRAAKARVLAAGAAFKPTVTLSAQAGFSGDRLLDFREDSFGTNATAAARWQLVDGGARDAGVDAAMASVEAADSLLTERWQTVIREVRQALEEHRSTIDKLTLYRENVSLSRTQVGDTKTRYNAGVETLTRVNEVLTELSIAEGNLAAGEIAVSLAWENVHYVLNTPSAE